MPRQSDARVAGGLCRPERLQDLHRQAAARRERRHLADPHAASPGSRPRRKRRRIAAAIARISSSPNRMPMQILGPAAERHVGALRELRPLLRREALGPEGVRVLEDVGQPVAGPGGVVDRELRRDPVAAELELGVATGAGRSTPAGRGGASPAPPCRARASRRRAGRRSAPRRPAHSVALVRQALGPLRVAGELVEEEGDGRGGRVVAGEQQRQDLVANLLVGEARCRPRPSASIRSPRMSSPASPARRRRAISPRMIPSSVRRTRRSRANGLPGAAQHLEEVLALIEGEPALERGGDVHAGPIRDRSPNRARIATRIATWRVQS